MKYIKIQSWRHFNNIEFHLPDDSSLICLTGSNGSGKSQVLELLAACAHKIGITSGNESNRSNPFSGDAIFEVQFYISEDIMPQLDTYIKNEDQEIVEGWDRTLKISKILSEKLITAGGVNENYSYHAANLIVSIIRSTESIHYLSLDADRAFPKIIIASHELGAVFDRDWISSNKDSSFRTTRNLFDEWFRYLLGTENRESGNHIQAIRKAREDKTLIPEFIDPFENYKNSVRKILPHLLFVGVDSTKREVKFDSTGLHLTFDQLSGGEREIAFLVGQIDRFGLSKGFLLLDEPELHLNNDLLRSWIGYLKNTVKSGQIWLATHSLEVVEVAGQDSTFLLERDVETKKVISAKPLSSQPLVAALSRTVGSPAFSISNLSFVFVEGTEEIGERERFRLLCELPNNIRFMEGGSCKEVVRRVSDLRALSVLSDQEIRVGGVIDSDWRTLEENRLFSAQGMHVLGVHEVENLFLHPKTINEIAVNIGFDPNLCKTILLDEFDRRAGSWIFDSTRTHKNFRDYSEPSSDVRSLVHSLSWSDFAEKELTCRRISELHGNLSEKEIEKIFKFLVVQAKIYERKSRELDFWKRCQGKEVARALWPRLGFSNDDAGERAVIALWKRRPDLVPEELTELRMYVGNL